MGRGRPAGGHVATDQDDDVSAQHLVLAVGVLSHPKTPDIPGVETFAGPTYFTSRWPHEGVDFTGQRVGVIGTGSSAIQSIPLIAEQADASHRVPADPGVLDAGHERARYDPDVVAARKADYDAYRQEARYSRIGVAVPLTEELATAADPGRARGAVQQRAGTRGRSTASPGSTSTSSSTPTSNEVASEFIRDRIRETVKDPTSPRHCSPGRTRTRPSGRVSTPTTTRRTTATTSSLVNLRETPIVEVDATGIVTTDGRHDIDALVLAIGFDAQTGPLLAINPVGVDGVELRDAWQDGPRNYLGLTTAGFPNMFMITGPGSPSVLTNMIDGDRAARRLGHRLHRGPA